MASDSKTAIVTGMYPNDKYLKILIPYLKNQTYKKFDIFVYDNSEKAGALDELKNNYPYINVIVNSKNGGFTAGNNSIFREILKNNSYKYAALVNDDTKPDAEWLSSLITRIESDEKIGAVASKLVYLEPFVRIECETESVSPAKSGGPQDTRELGIMYFIESGFENSDYQRKFFRDGFYGNEKYGDKYFQWTKNKFILDIPIGDNEKPLDSYKLKLHIRKNQYIPNQTLKISIGNWTTSIKLTDKENYEIQIPGEKILESKFDIIQNAASGLDKNHSGFDVGGGEIDTGQYDEIREPEMFCGGAVLIKTEVLKEVGIFDEYLFSYYEDSDLSLRVKKAGWKIVYEPKAVVRHFHAGSSVEWSPFFTYYAFRNRIVFIMKHFSVKDIFKAFWTHIKETIKFTLIAAKRGFRDKQMDKRSWINYKILGNLLINIPQILRKRSEIVKLISTKAAKS